MAPRWRDWDYGWYEPSRPREVKGGIKAQSKRGSFGESWWAKRWIQVLESFQIGARLGRGRSYARKGQVISIDVAKEKVTAKVQGSRADPYKVSIAVTALGKAEWRRVAEALSTQAFFTAKLLAGEMPNEIEEVFREAGVSLFPERLKDLKTDCSCPDWSNPCKHVAAVYYLLGEEFDRDPFLIFTLRGMARDEFMKLIGTGAEGAAKGGKKTHETEPAPEAPAAEPAPLVANPTAFWGGEAVADPLGDVRTPPVAAALVRRLGKFPFWRGAEGLVETLEPVYASATERALAVVAGDAPIE